jgi:hypothetical protein
MPRYSTSRRGQFESRRDFTNSDFTNSECTNSEFAHSEFTNSAFANSALTKGALTSRGATIVWLVPDYVGASQNPSHAADSSGRS